MAEECIEAIPDELRQLTQEIQHKLDWILAAVKASPIGHTYTQLTQEPWVGPSHIAVPRKWPTTPCILLWRFEDAPMEYQQLSPHGGDEDWVAFVPEALRNDWLVEMLLAKGTAFGRYAVSRHLVRGGVARIGAHG